MPAQDTWSRKLAQLELWEPGLGADLGASEHVGRLAAGRLHLTAYQLGALDGSASGVASLAYSAYVAALRLPPRLRSALARGSLAASHAHWYWPAAGPAADRAEGIRLDPPVLELQYSVRRQTYRLQAVAPALSEAQKKPALAWLAQPEQMRALAAGMPLAAKMVRALGLLPAWSELGTALDVKRLSVLEAGVRYLCRALATFPEILVLWRGLDGRRLLERFADEALAARQADFEAAASGLPSDPAEFWRELPLPGAAALDETATRLHEHLPVPDFWPKAEHNRLLLEALGKLYRAVPRKLGKWTARQS